MRRRKSLFWARRGVCDEFFYSCQSALHNVIFLSGGMSPNYRAVSVGTAIELIKGEERTDRHVYLFIIWSG